jgi:hypothetical protein
MATTLATNQIKAILGWDFESTLIMGNSTNIATHSVSTSMTNRTGAAGTADLIYSNSVTIAASGNTTVTFTSLASLLGVIMSFARIKAFIIENNSLTTASSILIGNGTNPFINWVGSGAHTVRVRNGGALMLFCTDATAYAVTAATGDLLKILNEDGANSATVHMTVIGSSV